MAVPQDDRTYTVAEAADELGVSASTVWRWIDAKLLPAQRIGRRKIRIRREDLALVVSPARPPQDASGDPCHESRRSPTAEELQRRQALGPRLPEIRQRLKI